MGKVAFWRSVRILSKIEEWCALQVSNLQNVAKSLGNSKVDAQGDSQKLIPLGHDLSLVVTKWSKLSAPLKTAILAIVGSVNTPSEDVR